MVLFLGLCHGNLSVSSVFLPFRYLVHLINSLPYREQSPFLLLELENIDLHRFRQRR